jgi:hypothetical protein
MAIDLKKRLQNLQGRRLVTDDSTRALAKALGLPEQKERYQERTNTDATQYALGAMQEVDPKYTKITFEQSERVQQQLDSDLRSVNIGVAFDYQGSVPLNVHIRGASDIDLLVLLAGVQTLDWGGPRAGNYTRVNGSIVDDLVKLRRNCESILSTRFPSAIVDKSGSKSIPISGGSLQRKVDVVPAHWHDTSDYQRTGEKHYREVGVLDKNVPASVRNRPFMFMKLINDKDQNTSGGTKKVIRLLKSLRNDADYELPLSSYDIGSLVWHFDDTRLRVSTFQELSLVALTLDAFRELSLNKARAQSLDTPDRSRKIIDDDHKFQSIQILTSDLEELAVEIARELSVAYRLSPSTDGLRRVLTEAQV